MGAPSCSLHKRVWDVSSAASGAVVVARVLLGRHDIGRFFDRLISECEVGAYDSRLEPLPETLSHS